MISNLERALVYSAFLALVTGAPAISAQPVSLSPKMIAAKGLPVRADTLDGYVGDAADKQFYGYYIYAVSRATVGGRDAYLVTMNYGGGGFQSDTTALDAATLTPIWRRFHARDDTLSVTYTGRHASGIAHQNRNGDITRKPVDHQLSDSAFSSGLLRWVIGALPLKEGYAFSLTTFSEWANAEVTPVMSIVGTATVPIHGKPVDTWLLKLPSGGERWIEKSTGRIVQERDPRGLGNKDAWLVRR